MVVTPGENDRNRLDGIVSSMAQNPMGTVLGAGLTILGLTHATNARADSLVASLNPSSASITVHDLDAGGSSSISLPAGTSTYTLDGFDDGNGNAILSTTDGSVAPYYGTGTDGIVVTDGSSATLELSFPYPGRLAPNLDESTFAVPSLYDGSLSIVRTDFSDEESYNSLSGSVVLAFAADEADQYAVATDYVSGGSSIHVLDLGSDTDGDGLPDSGDSIVSTDDFSTADPMDYGQSLTLDRTNDVAYAIGAGTSDTVDGSTTVRLDINTGSIIEVNTEDASGNPVNANQLIHNPTDGYVYAVGVPTSGSYNCVILQLNPSDLSVNSELGHSSSCASSAVEFTIEANGVYAWLEIIGQREVDLSTMSFTGTTTSTSYSASALVHVTTTTSTDSDGDGVDVETDGDCDDADATIGAPSTLYEDADGDGYGDEATGATTCPASGYVEDDTDCDDASNVTFPGAAELESTTDCMTDADTDGYGDSVVSGSVTAGTDCDDGDATVGAPSSHYDDSDGDGYGDAATGATECPDASNTTDATDCDDGDVTAFPGATEVCDGDLENCDLPSADYGATTTYYADLDLDGYGNSADSMQACAETGDYTATEGGDTDDTSGYTYPGDPYCEWGAEGDWSPEANCTVDLGNENTFSGWSVDRGYTLEINGDDEPVITYHGTDGEMTGERDGDVDIGLYPTEEGGDAAWISGSIGRVRIENGEATFTVVDEGDAAVHYALFESEVEDITREDNVRILEGQQVVTNTEEGGVKTEKTTAVQVLAAVQTDTGTIDTGPTDTDVDDTAPTEDDTGPTENDSGEHVTPPSDPDCGGCDQSGEGLPKGMLVPGLLGLAVMFRRRQIETELKLTATSTWGAER